MTLPADHSIHQVRHDAYERFERLCKARDHLVDAKIGTTQAATIIADVWHEWPETWQAKAEPAAALSTLVTVVWDKLDGDINAVVEQLAFLIARDVIAAHVKESKEALVPLTGNAYMPALREVDQVEVIWKNDRDGLWDRFVEALDAKLEKHKIQLESPEWDNSLYAFDFDRWEYTGDLDDTEARWDNANYTETDRPF